VTAPVRKRDQAADLVRARIADGSLKPGMTAPTGEQLARETGFHVLTCRAALRILLDEGALTRVSRNGRSRVADPDAPAGGADAELSRELAGRRRHAGLTQQQLADKVGFSVTTVGHAETGRVWQSRAFWDAADLALDAHGSMLARYDAWKALPAVAPAPTAEIPGVPAAPVQPDEHDLPGGIVITIPCDPTPFTVRWRDGTVTTVQPGPSSG
jgi:GntR family transcriptional regulator